MDEPASSSLELIVDVTYAAGLLDGEGYVGIMPMGTYFHTRVKIAMTDKATECLTQVAQTFGGNITPGHPGDDHRRRTLEWRLNGAHATDFLRRVRPHLIVKALPADLAISLQEMVDAAPRRPNGQAVWDEEMRRRASILHLRIQEANRTGPDPEPPVLPTAKPLAVRRWGAWWDPVDSLFGPVEFQGTMPKSGLMIAGHIYALPMSAPPTAEPESSSLLATPRVAASRTGRSAAVRRDSMSGPSLEQNIELAQGQLPREFTSWDEMPPSWPRPLLLPTPAAGVFNDGESVESWTERRDRVKATGVNGNGMGTPLSIAVQLLPTPRATDGTKDGPNQRGSSGDLMLPSAVMGFARHAVTPSSTMTPEGSALAGAAGHARMQSSAVPLLPTPTTQPTTGNGHTRNLGKEVQLLPTPVSTDWKRGAEPAEMERHSPSLGAITHLLSAAGNESSDGELPGQLSLGEPDASD